jgi:hypothetical protein
MRQFLLILLLFTLTTCSLVDENGTRIRVRNELDNELRDLVWTFNSGQNEGTESRLRPGRATGYVRFDGADECEFQLEALLVGTGTITGGFVICGEPAPIAEGAWTLTLRRPLNGMSEFETVLLRD